MERTVTYLTHDIPVRGGTLRVGEWRPDNPDAPTIVAAHGITASHLAWAKIADEMPEVRLIAPDLRGRGRSSQLPGPYGMAEHARDLASVSQTLDLGRALITGHSMGGFVALVAAHLYPEYFDGPLLIDGGLPLDVPAGAPTGAAPVPTLGPAADRLSMTFPTRDSYLEFWQKHPAFASEWNEKVEDYVNYDLVGTEPELRASTSLAAMSEDSAELFAGESVLAALSALQRPLTLLTAPRGLLDETPGLYSAATVARWREELPDIAIREVADVNHYTIVMGSGATTVASALRSELAALR